MPKNPNLIPTPITDRNGRQTTVYTKPTTSPAPVTAIPAPSYRNIREGHKEFLVGIAKRIDADNARYFGSLRLSDKIQSATNEELTILADTLTAHPEYEETFAEAASQSNTGWRNVVSLAVIYTPDFAKETTPRWRMYKLKNALERAYHQITGAASIPLGGWSLANEKPDTIAKVRRYAAAWYILHSADTSPTPELTERLLDNTRTDHDETFNILRSNPHATVEQIDFILNNGPASLSSGAL